MSRRSDVIVTTCVVASLVFDATATVVMAMGNADVAVCALGSACYLVLLAIFAILYVRRDDGRG